MSFNRLSRGFASNIMEKKKLKDDNGVAVISPEVKKENIPAEFQ